ncbi:MAG TPA: FecR domain-containing protein [Prolixibacteraceae bacterium]|nr:FecR domain-containing protein [Prolixibacteraceae bacterium]
MEEYNDIEHLFIRYFSRETTPEDEKELLDWISRSEKHKSDFFKLKDIWDSTLKAPDRTAEQLALFYQRAYIRSRKSYKTFILRAAALAAVLVIAAIIVVLVPQMPEIPEETFQVFTVPLGSRSKVTLVDGTEVNLNSGSELTVSNQFSGKNRVATLSGEAFFNVKSDSKHPFLVRTSQFDIRVTGTKFNVCAYNEDVLSTATLAEGKIELQIRKEDKVLDINPGEKFAFNRTAQNFTLSEADVEQEIAWKNGEFIFKKIMFPDLVKRLERWYDVRLISTDEHLANYSYSGRFKNQETIWQVFDALKLTSPIDYSRSSFREFKIIYKP